MDRWTEIRTAYKLAQLGTLSATAEALGIHRSTVMRQIDVLEQELEVKLFQRNDKGYLATGAGLEIMRLGEITDSQINHFVNKAKAREEVVEGEIKITCVGELALLLLPAIEEFQQKFPKVRFDVMADIRKYDLEYGEADIAVRTGQKPTTLDNVVLPFQSVELAFCAHKTYITKYGLPNKDNIHEHKFVANSQRLPHLPWNEWIHNNIAQQQIVLSSSTHQVLNYALQTGLGISVAAKAAIDSHPQFTEIELGENWQVETWILVHRDLINIAKIRKFVDLLKGYATADLNFTLL